MKLNLPLTVDEFNNEHADFIKNFFMKQNPDKTIPFVMNYITYKKYKDQGFCFLFALQRYCKHINLKNVQ